LLHGSELSDGSLSGSKSGLEVRGQGKDLGIESRSMELQSKDGGHSRRLATAAMCASSAEAYSDGEAGRSRQGVGGAVKGAHSLVHAAQDKRKLLFECEAQVEPDPTSK
jgi:hypothetical protein